MRQRTSSTRDLLIDALTQAVGVVGLLAGLWLLTGSVALVLLAASSVVLAVGTLNSRRR